MNSNEFKDKLTSVTPEVPEHFHNRVEMTLENIVMQEAQKNNTTKQTTKTTGRFSRRTFTIALAVTLFLGAAAFAATTQWHLFESISFLTGSGTPKNADSVMQSDLYRETVNNVEITVREAAYDGRTLLIQYSYRILDAETPYAVTAGEIFGANLPDGMSADTVVESVPGEAVEALEAHGVGSWISTIWIEGQELDMYPGSGRVVMGSTTPGEIIYTNYYRLDHGGVSLNGSVQITLPIGEKQSDEYLSNLYESETHTYRLPDKGVVTFAYNAGDTASKTEVIRPDRETVLAEGTVCVREAVFSPLMTYITLSLQADPERKLQEDELDIFEDWLFSLELIDGSGNILFPDEYGLNEHSRTAAEFLYPYMDTVPDELYLAPVDENGTADMDRAVLVKPDTSRN